MNEFAFLLMLAAQMSGLPSLPPGTEPAVWTVTETQMRALVCRDNTAVCNGLQAIYDSDANRILILEYGGEHGVEWESFLLHEFVHALQYAQRGEAIYADCPALRATEQLAYAVQDAYLRSQNSLLRVGTQMWWWHCGDPTAARK